MKKILFRLVIVGVLAAAAYGGYTAYKQIPQKQQAQIPTTKVRQGDVIVKTFARGELRAVRSATLTAPNLFGTVQVTKLAALGAFAKEKDLVAEFDDSELLSRLEEKELEIEQVDEQIKKSQADLNIRDNQDQVELLRTRYSVRRAELEVQRNELLSAIDRKRNDLSLEEAKRRLKQLESDIKSRREQAQAELAVLRERKNKALLELNREKMRLQQVKLLSPMSGLVAIRQNRGGGFFNFGQQIPDIREGDQLQPGMPVADILDLSELEVLARVGELDRANLREGQDVILHLDAIADEALRGKIKSMSGTATANVFSSDPAKKFDVLFSIDMSQLLKALGANQEEINRVLATAEANRKRAPLAPPPSMFAMAGQGMPGGQMPGGGGQGGQQGMPGGQMPGGGGQQGGQSMSGPGGMQAGGPPQAMFRPGGQGGPAAGGARGGGMEAALANLPADQQKKAREIFRKAFGGKSPAEMTPEDRTAAFTKMREEMQKAGINMPGRGGNRPGGGGAAAGAGAAGAAAEQAGAGGGPGGGRRRAGGGEGGGMMFGMGGASQQFSQKDLDAAKLPPAPEESSQLDVLLRPGLLADVEIIVEKIPNAIHIPVQAIFEKEGKNLVYVKEKGKFVARVIKPLKRSESTMIISDGLKAGEEISLQDPEAKPSDRKKGGQKSDGGGGGGGSMPMGMGRKG
ncbi:MAG: efflux RND transporter periplasmic adaptor subunit [Bryobacterales bacterium]|nr:efflux RND transporter periplasmic adaptor subunit [Bryobacterales bacterium]